MLSIADPAPDRQPKVAPQLEGARSASLLYLNSNISTDTPEGSPSFPLPQKAAFALGENVHRFCSLYGLENCGFLTLTFPDNVTCHKEASRRFNSMNTHYLGTFYGEWIWARERQKRGAWHYHLVVQCRGTSAPGLIGTSTASGSPTTARASAAASAPVTPSCAPCGRSYGFGRVELLPIRSTVDAVASYVGKYIGKQIDQRPEEDKGFA